MNPDVIGLETLHPNPHARAVLQGGTVSGEVSLRGMDAAGLKSQA